MSGRPDFEHPDEIRRILARRVSEWFEHLGGLPPDSSMGTLIADALMPDVLALVQNARHILAGDESDRCGCCGEIGVPYAVMRWGDVVMLVCLRCKHVGCSKCGPTT